MKKNFVCALVLAGALLGGCSQSLSVAAPTISPMDFASQEKTPGKYAVMVQKGAWHTEVKAAGFACSAWSFPTDFETAYDQAIAAGIEQSFANVVMTPAALKPDEMKAQDIDAQIVIYEGTITANFAPSPNFFTVSFNSTVAMDGIVAVIGHDGKVHQGNAHGSGTGSAETFAGCGVAGDAIKQAGSNAIREYVRNAINSAKINVLEIKAQTAAKGNAPTS